MLALFIFVWKGLFLLVQLCVAKQLVFFLKRSIAYDRFMCSLNTCCMDGSPSSLVIGIARLDM